MLDVKFIRQFPDRVRKALEDRNAGLPLDAFLGLEESDRKSVV